jgi:hypothetical protein
MKCPPLEIDAALTEMIETYRAAKSRAAAASRKRAQVETGGHYDKDTPLAQRAVVETEESVAERLAAIRVADELLQWIEKHRAT